MTFNMMVIKVQECSYQDADIIVSVMSQLIVNHGKNKFYKIKHLISRSKGTRCFSESSSAVTFVFAAWAPFPVFPISLCSSSETGCGSTDAAVFPQQPLTKMAGQ